MHRTARPRLTSKSAAVRRPPCGSSPMRGRSPPPLQRYQDAQLETPLPVTRHPHTKSSTSTKHHGRRPRDNEICQLLLAACAMHAPAHCTGQAVPVLPCGARRNGAQHKRRGMPASHHLARHLGGDPLQRAQPRRRRCNGPHARPGAALRTRRLPRALRRAQAGRMRHARPRGRPRPDAPGGARLRGGGRSGGQRGGGLRRGPCARAGVPRRVARARPQALQAGQAGGDRAQASNRDGGPCQIQAAQRRQTAQRARACVAHPRAVGQVQALQARAPARQHLRARRGARGQGGRGSGVTAATEVRARRASRARLRQPRASAGLGPAPAHPMRTGCPARRQGGRTAGTIGAASARPPDSLRLTPRRGLPRQCAQGHRRPVRCTPRGQPPTQVRKVSKCA
jgi:hypothetical protein